MEVRNEELRTTRELAREVSACLDALNKGDLKKIVVTKNGKLSGVLISVEEYDRLVG
jgi:prevent-host-death family protein